MFQDNSDFVKMVEYMKAHWPSKVKDEWQVSLEEYPEILQKVMEDFTAGDKSQKQELVRIAGLSGSGKTTQLLPAVEAYFRARQKNPVLVAARRFVEYHPHFKEILEFYGKENLRKMTDEFATILMFMTLKGLTQNHYDIILDVTLLDPEIEAILVKMLDVNNYEMMLTIIAASPEVTEKFLSGREWRHTKETEQEFIRATRRALKFYVEEQPGMRTVMWNTYDEKPVHDGLTFSDAVDKFDKYSSETEIPKHNVEKLKLAKIKYLSKIEMPIL